MLFAIGGLVAAGCGSDGSDGSGQPDDGPPPAKACTQASCVGSALVRLREIPADADSIRVCVEGRCKTVRDGVSGGVRVPMPPEDRSGGASVHIGAVFVEVRDRAGEVLVRRRSSIRLTAVRPNGRRCSPICWGGEVRIDLDPARREPG